MNVTFISEGPSYLENLEEIAIPTYLSGAKIHDARIAALCLVNGVKVLWTSDRDFSLFPTLKTKNPLI